MHGSGYAKINMQSQPKSNGGIVYIYSIAYTKQNDLLAHFPHVVIGNYVTFNTVIMCLRCEARNHHQEYDKFIAYAWIFNVEYGDNAGVVWVRSNRW